MSDAWKDREKGMENEYFHRREQEVIEKMREKLAAENVESSRMNCPRGDGGKLIETDFEDVKIDVCEKCAGVWLDAGELAQLVHKQEDTWVSRLFGYYPESK
jgi:uncharacterized protein